MEKGQFESFINLNITEEGRDVYASGSRTPPPRDETPSVPPKLGRKANLPLQAAARGHVIPLVV